MYLGSYYMDVSPMGYNIRRYDGKRLCWSQGSKYHWSHAPKNCIVFTTKADVEYFIIAREHGRKNWPAWRGDNLSRFTTVTMK
jgi:predicted lipoprotein with Yx(FWY)xxD motif